MKIYVVGGESHYSNWIYEAIDFVGSVKEADLVIFTGGSDVSSIYYNEKQNHKTYNNKTRDDDEFHIYIDAVTSRKCMLGICRGSQFLTAMQDGGRLVQHVENHATGYVHEIEFSDGSALPITSTHHQMMYPFDIDNYELIAWSKNRLSYRYEFGPGETYLEIPMNKEPEIVFYPDTKCLAIQGHPSL